MTDKYSPTFLMSDGSECPVERLAEYVRLGLFQGEALSEYAAAEKALGRANHRLDESVRAFNAFKDSK